MIRIYDAQGRLVRMLDLGQRATSFYWVALARLIGMDITTLVRRLLLSSISIRLKLVTSLLCARWSS